MPAVWVRRGCFDSDAGSGGIACAVYSNHSLCFNNGGADWIYRDVTSAEGVRNSLPERTMKQSQGNGEGVRGKGRSCSGLVRCVMPNVCVKCKDLPVVGFRLGKAT